MTNLRKDIRTKLAKIFVPATYVGPEAKTPHYAIFYKWWNVFTHFPNHIQWVKFTLTNQHYPVYAHPNNTCQASVFGHAQIGGLLFFRGALHAV
jgi:hypothetical protein